MSKKEWDSGPEFFMSEDEFYNMLDKLEEINVPASWPDLDGIDLFESNPEKYLPFAIYIHDVWGAKHPPRTSAEKYSKKNLFHFIQEHTVIED